MEYKLTEALEDNKIWGIESATYSFTTRLSTSLEDFVIFIGEKLPELQLSMFKLTATKATLKTRIEVQGVPRLQYRELVITKVTDKTFTVRVELKKRAGFRFGISALVMFFLIPTLPLSIFWSVLWFIFRRKDTKKMREIGYPRIKAVFEEDLVW